MRPLQVILLCGLVAGSLDILDPIVFYGLRSGVFSLGVFRAIAAGLMGPAARQGGTGTVLLGAALHYLIATTAAAVFFFARKRITFLRAHAVWAGLLYGSLVWLFMNFVVLPLSKNGAPKMAMNIPMLNGVLAVVLLVGLPISLLCKRLDATSPAR